MIRLPTFFPSPWHAVRVVKHGTSVKLRVDGVAQGEFTTRERFTPKSPWVLRRHGAWEGGALDARFRNIIRRAEP